MAISRAFSMHVKRSEDHAKRSASVRYQISSPIALVSTTNMLSYTAPDIIRPGAHTRDQSIPSTPSTPDRSSLDNDSDTSTPSNASTAATSVESSPVTNRSPSDFRKTPTPYLATAAIVQDKPGLLKPVTTEEMPILPKRALSHSKREHERLARKRSQRFSRPGSAQSIIEPLSTCTSVADSTLSPKSDLPTDSSTVNPFSKELEQLSEVAEEFGTVAREVAIEEDLAVMESHHLLKFTADEYLQEIQPLWTILLNEWRPKIETVSWI